MKKIVLVLSLSVLVALVAPGAEQKEAAEAMVLPASAMKWSEAPPTLPAGATMTVLEGDPKAAGPYTVRLKAPDGYRIPPHSHPAAEHITVISGKVHLGMGEKFDESAGRELTAGDYAVLPAHRPHYAWMTGETVLQISSTGPYTVHKVGAADPAGAKP